MQLIIFLMQIDLMEIMEVYQEKYETSLLQDITEDTSGDYGLLLQRILKGASEEDAVNDEAELVADEGEDE